jgi:hypothetical protein
MTQKRQTLHRGHPMQGGVVLQNKQADCITPANPQHLQSSRRECAGCRNRFELVNPKARYCSTCNHWLRVHAGILDTRKALQELDR